MASIQCILLLVFVCFDVAQSVAIGIDLGTTYSVSTCSALVCKLRSCQLQQRKSHTRAIMSQVVCIPQFTYLTAVCWCLSERHSEHHPQRARFVHMTALAQYPASSGCCTRYCVIRACIFALPSCLSLVPSAVQARHSAAITVLRTCSSLCCATRL